MRTLEELAQLYPLSVEVTEEAAGLSLSALVARASGLSLADAALLVRRGGVWLGRQRLAQGWQPAPGTQLQLHTPPGGAYATLELGPEDLIYEDQWLLALNKQPGWFTVPTPWDLEANVEAALRRLEQRRGADPGRLHLAHRLDRDTSGVLLVSRDPAINATLQERFDSGAVAKRYLALAAGELERDEIELRTGHGRGESGLFRLYPAELIGQRLGPDRRPIREARTSFRVLARYLGATLVEALLHTGRTHQIRLHLRELGHPIAGDRRYGGPTQLAGLELEHQLLHAGQLELAHPVTRAPLQLCAPLPERFVQVVGRLERAGYV